MNERERTVVIPSDEPTLTIIDVENKNAMHISEAPQKIAKSNFVGRNDDGNLYSDVVFSQNGHDVPVSDILSVPELTIAVSEFETDENEYITHSRGRYYASDKVVDLIFKRSDNQQTKNVVTLHEISHAYDCEVNEEKYIVLGQDIVARRVAQYSLSSPDNLHLHHVLNLIRWEYSQLGCKINFAEDYSPVIERLSSLTPDNPADIRSYRAELENQIDIESERIKAVHERNAWHHTLESIRHLRDEGITVFDGNIDNLFRYIDRCLSSYQHLANELSDGITFIKPKLLRKAEKPFKPKDKKLFLSDIEKRTVYY